MDQKTKNVALEKFLEQTTLKPCNFWAGEALDAGRQDCLNITLAQKWHSDIFQISAEKSFQAWQKGSCTFLYNFGGCDLQKDLYVHSIGAGNPFYQAWKLFSAEIWKISECHFWADVMLRQSRLRASRASPAQKLQDLRVVLSKNFSRATFFVFWVTYLVDIYLSYLPMKQIWWKSAVCVRGRHSLVAPGLVQWKLGYIKKKMTESRSWTSDEILRRSKIILKNVKKIGKNQLDTCNNDCICIWSG